LTTFDGQLNLKNHYFTVRYAVRVSFHSNDCHTPINAGCFESLENGSEALSYIPLMMHNPPEADHSFHAMAITDSTGFVAKIFLN